MKDRQIVVDEVLSKLSSSKVRCTYAALRDHLGLEYTNAVFRFLGEKRPEASWIVRQDDLLPGKYRSEDIADGLTESPVLKSAKALERFMEKGVI